MLSTQQRGRPVSETESDGPKQIGSGKDIVLKPVLKSSEYLHSVTAIRTEVPSQAHTASYLGSEREGSAVVIDNNGTVLTIGYLLLESNRIWIRNQNSEWVAADFVGYDFESGFGLARAREPLNLTPMELGDSSSLSEGEEVCVVAYGDEEPPVRTNVVGRQEFAGYWEYLIENAIFTSPAHPKWSGAPLVGTDGRIKGIGSLLLDEIAEQTTQSQGNMFVPTELLLPILDDLLSKGRAPRPPRPWLGIFAADTQKGPALIHVSPEGPADHSGLQPEDVILRVDKNPIEDVADLYRRIWGVGEAGSLIPLTIMRDTVGVELKIKSSSRYDFFRTPRE